MAGSVNKWIGIGNLGKDVETKFMPSGEPVASFSIACTETWKDKNGEKVEKTEWVNVVAFRKLAEICAQHLKKGAKIYVEGKLSTSSYEKNGEKRYSTKVIIDHMVMLGGGNGNGGNGGAKQQAPRAASSDQYSQTSPDNEGSYETSEIPF
jgi:single-strand DNA-binding protein